MQGYFFLLKPKNAKRIVASETAKYTCPHDCGTNSPITNQATVKRVTPITKRVMDFISKTSKPKLLLDGL
jgi:hypothetical protein